jgi:formate-nitrite transporter family protein
MDRTEQHLRESSEQQEKKHSADGQQEQGGSSDPETEEAENRQAPSGTIVYKAIFKEGSDELERPSSALFWSGLAAGLSMGFSMVAEGLLQSRLPETEWRNVITTFGYSIGFLIVILGRQQLFTENTLTVILPLLQRKDLKTLANVGRLWLVVLIANILGALAFAAVAAHSPVFEEHTRQTFAQLGHEAMAAPFATTLLRGIFGGWLIALMVWLLPFAETSRVLVIIIVTYLVGLGHFSHVIAGAIDTLFLVVSGAAGVGEWFIRFFLPALLGNIIGGVALVAVLNHAQVVGGGHGQDM